MATGQRPRSDAGNRDLLDPDGSQRAAERPATKQAVQGMLLRCVHLIEHGDCDGAQALLTTAYAFLETITDPLGEKGKARRVALVAVLQEKGK